MSEPVKPLDQQMRELRPREDRPRTGRAREVPCPDNKGSFDVRIDERLVTARELALRWGCSDKRLTHARMRGDLIPFVRIGRSIRYRLSDIVRHENQSLCRSTSDAGGAND